MPSKEELENMRRINADNTDMKSPNNILGVGIAADMEELVAAIKHNLRLKSKSCHSNLCSKQKRVSPYDVPSRTSCKKHSGEFCPCVLTSNNRHNNNNRNHQKSVQNIDDPYEMLQVLLREGSLIKEAVKRLQLEGNQESSSQSPFTTFKKKKDSIDFYEHECSICDLPTTMVATTQDEAAAACVL